MRFNQEEFDKRLPLAIVMVLGFLAGAIFGWGGAGFPVGWIGYDIYRCFREKK